MPLGLLVTAGIVLAAALSIWRQFAIWEAETTTQAVQPLIEALEQASLLSLELTNDAGNRPMTLTERQRRIATVTDRLNDARRSAGQLPTRWQNGGGLALNTQLDRIAADWDALAAPLRLPDAAPDELVLKRQHLRLQRDTAQLTSALRADHLAVLHEIGWWSNVRLGLLLVTLGMLLALWWRRMLGPVHTLATQAPALLDGSPSRPLGALLARHDELGSLARSLTGGAQLLSSSLGQLRQQTELMAQAEDLVALLSPNGQLLYLNPAGCALFGLDPADLDRQRHDVQPYLGNDWLAALPKALAGGGTWLGELSARRGDGRTAPLSVAVQAHRDAQGEVVRYALVGRDLTVLRELQQALNDSDAHYFALLDQFPIAFWASDAQGHNTYVNPALLALCGRSAESLRVEGWLGLVHPDERAQVHRQWREAAEGQHDNRARYRLRRADGQWRWVLDIGVPRRDAQQRCIGFLGMVIDIHDQVMAEATAREHEAELRRIVEALPVGVWLAGEDGTLRYANAAAERLWGGVREVGPDRYDEYRAWWVSTGAPIGAADWGMARALRHGETSLNELIRIQRFDGDYRIMLSSALPLRDADGRITGALAINQDITAYRQFQQQVDLLTQVVEHSVNGVMIADAQQAAHPIVYVNPAFSRITGYAPEEALGQPCCFLQGDDADQPDQERLRTALQAGEAAHALLRSRRKDGTAFWNEFHVTPVRQDNDGVVTHYIGVLHDVSERKAFEAELEYQASFDPLTRLPNRQLLHDRLQQAIARAARQQGVTGLMLLDLDRFKYVNDSLGHEVGDALLMQAAERLTEAVREVDTVAHPGGDEFALVVSDIAHEDGLTTLAGKLLCCFDAPFHVDGHELFVSASVGIATYPRDGIDPPALLKNAEVALYRAKEEGRSRFAFFRAELLARAEERLALEAQLRGAAQRGEFELYYQPQADLQSGELLGAEALIRWRHPDLGLVPPSRFIPVAEDGPLIVAIGEWVLDEACRQAAQWRAAGLPPLTVAVNLSARQFRDPGLLDMIHSIYVRHGLTAGQLELELTESMVVEQPERVIQLLRHLGDMGVGLALDDFGTGYSSLSYLKRFPLHKVKIDRSFVRDLVGDPDSAAIARAIISLAHDMRMRVIAEGVETEAQAAALRRQGCDELQGFWYSQPLTADAFTRLLGDPHVLPWQTPPVDGPERALLLVDDEPSVLTALSRALRHEGYRLLTARGGADALTLLAQQEVGVILSDQRMPDMMGVELLRRARQMYPGTVRIILSGYADVLEIAQAINEGAIFRFISKPWDDKVLKMHLKEAFELRELNLRRMRGDA